MKEPEMSVAQQLAYDRVSKDLSDPEIINNDTLQLLKALLGLQPKIAPKRPTKTRLGTKAAPRRPPATTKGTQRPVNRKEAVKFEIHDELATDVEPLDPKKRKKLATSTFNSALKYLSDAAKSRHTQSAGSPRKTTKDSTVIVQPLKSNASKRGVDPEVATTTTADVANSLLLTSKCASVALDCLRALEEDSHGKDYVDNSVENGGLIILDRLITLELHDTAKYQSIRLHEQYWKRRKEQKSSQGLFEQFYVGHEHDVAMHKFATSFQSQLLRLALLKGTSALGDGFSGCFDPQVQGTPAWTTIQGHADGLLDSASCGNQLRTMSLAMSKLHATLEKTCPANLRVENLGLATSALQVKCISWKHLGHPPDFTRELWTPLSGVIKRSMTAAEDKALMRTQAQRCLESIISSLLHLGFRSTPPAALQSYCGKHASVKPVSTKSLAENQVENTDTGIAALEAFASVLGEQETNHGSVIDGAHECIEVFNHDAKLALDHASSLVSMTRLRKAATSLLEQQTDTGQASASSEDAQVSLIKLICTMASFCCRVNSRQTKQQTPLTPREQGGMLLSYAKTIETIVHLESLPISHGEALANEFQSGLCDCVTLAIDVRSKLGTVGLSGSVRDFLRAVPVRISHLLWKRYLSYTEHSQPPAVRLCVLNLSIEVLKDASWDEKKVALLGLKHDRASSVYLEEKAFSKAQASLSYSIQFYIEEAAVHAASGLTFNDRAQREIQAALDTEYLNQSLKKYVQLSLGHNIPNSRGSWYFDDSEQHNFIRALLLQKQILLALRSGAHIEYPQLSAVIQLWEQLCSGPDYLSSRLDYISQLLDVLAKQKDYNAVLLLKTLSTLQEIDNDAGKQSATLQHRQISYFVVSVQWTLAKRRMDENAFTDYVSILPELADQLGICKKTVADTRALAASIRALADLAGMYGLTQEQAQLADFLLHLQQSPVGKDEKNHDNLRLQLEIAKLKLELDDTYSAGKVLVATELASATVPHTATEWSLTSAEYHLLLGNPSKAKDLLGTPMNQFTSAHKTVSSKTKLDQELQLCRATLLASKVARQLGNLLLATRFARQAVKISSSVWSSFEPMLRSSGEFVSNGNESSLQSLTQDMSSLAILETIQQDSSVVNNGARYWTLVSLHRRILRHGAQTLSHSGLYQDAVYFAQQASKITSWTGGLALQASVNSELAVIYTYALEHDKAQKYLPTNIVQKRDHSTELRWTLLNCAEASMHMGDTDSAAKHLQIIRHMLANSSSVSGPKKSSERPVQRTKAVNKSSKRYQKPAQADAEKPLKQLPDSEPISQQTRDIQSRLTALENDLLCIQGLPKNYTLTPCNIATLAPLELVSRAIVFIQEALKQFATDPSSNAICETALAMPVRYRHVRKSGQMSLLLDQSPLKARTSAIAGATGGDILIRAYDCLRSVDVGRLPMLSTAQVNILHKALSQVVLLSTAACKPLNYTPLNVVLQSLRPKDVSRSRERCAISSERETATYEQIHRWPVTHEDAEQDEDFTGLVQKLPNSWTITSIGLSHDGKELLLSRIISDSSPFLMRVPLERPGVDDDEPCEFTLDYAKEELRDIISKANDSCHDSRGSGDKQARKSWYTEREHLDKRLETLLANMENVWLGGFRGLLSPTDTDRALLARFGETLLQSLDKHLPSRQKRSKSQTKIQLHAHVLELFTSIKFDEGNVDFEDSVTDLLYFVVDILQFNGEPNAFDEIDFDALLLDTIDALRGYHTAHTTSSPRHTILIIDKELQSFPWESLPCLRGHPVSRMPSLGAIQERLNRMAPDTDSYTVCPTSGAYILNPSSDLANTKTTFLPLLSQLHPNFSALIDRSPTEQDFSSLLANNPILLYFGHGSGTQYIRGRTIRSLPQCAVTWLMGCSSAKLTECGLYESYGTPSHYMHAGSPAMVGTLWDVTDRDVDRFAVKALGAWGLIDVGGVEETFWGPGPRGKAKAGASKRTGKGKGKVPQPESQEGGAGQEKRKVTLDQAVAEARDACNLRYLNGAAPVIYGVPVSLA